MWVLKSGRGKHIRLLCSSPKIVMTLFGLVCVLAVGFSACAAEATPPVSQTTPERPETMKNSSSRTPSETVNAFMDGSTEALAPTLTATVQLEKTEMLPGQTPQAGVQAAIDDLAGRLNVEPALIGLISISADEFPAGDLGCPDPKKPSKPLDAIVSGQRVLLEFEGQDYEYHIRPGQVVYCGIR